MNLLRNRDNKNRSRRRRRRGTEVVELAIILPLIVLITTTTLEICENTFLIQKLEIAAHEGAVVGITRTSTLSDVENAVQNYLDARNVDYGGDISTAVSVTPDPATADTLTPITVTVTVSADDNSRIGALYRFFNGRTVVGDITMFKEFGN